MNTIDRIRVMKRKPTLRIVFLTLAILLTLPSLLIVLTASGVASQIAKNKIILADMRDCVLAIKGFEKKFNRLPSETELPKLANSLPPRCSSSYDFQLGPPPLAVREKPAKWSDSNGWMIWYWRGEWAEYYSSSNDYYSVEDATSWWGAWGPFLFAPFGAILFFYLASLRISPTRLGGGFD